jgi:hypothetical protein
MGQGDCPSPREFGHLQVSTGGATIVDGARITRVGLELRGVNNPSV